MGKYSNFEKKEKDFYATIDPVCVGPLVHFAKGSSYYEPCCGDGSLTELLLGHLYCAGESDIDGAVGKKKDALTLTREDLYGIDMIITNPPFTWPVLKPMLDHFPTLAPTWLLLPADFMHNKRFKPYLENCSRIVSIGRMYWEQNKVKGKQNFCWYFFPKGGWGSGTRFYGTP